MTTTILIRWTMNTTLFNNEICNIDSKKLKKITVQTPYELNKKVAKFQININL